MAAKTKKIMTRKPKPRKHDHEYHVVWNGTRKSWDIERDGGHGAQFAFDQSTAIGLAIREARIEARDGANVVVCLQLKDGSFHLEWASE